MIKNKCIILVEDSDSDRLLYSKYLSQLGYETRSFDNCESLLNILSSLESSVILLDIELPGITGVEAAKYIRSNHNTDLKRHTLIAITSHNDCAMLDIFVEAGFDDYLQKPFMKRELESKLQKFLVQLSAGCQMSVCNDKIHTSGKFYSLEMFEGEDADFIKSIIQIFVTNTPQTLELIEKAQQVDDMETLRQQVHKIKPHYSFFGARDLQVVMQQIEDIARTNQKKELLPELICCVGSKSKLILDQMKSDFNL